MRRYGWLVAVAMAVGTAAVGQERAVQIGVKTSDAGYAVAVDITIPMDDMAKAGETFSKAFDDLQSMAEAEGFTLLGPTRIALKNMGPTPDQKMPFQLQMLIVDQPTEEDMAAEFGFEIVQLEAVQVAYTYHKGGLDQVHGTFMGLITWIQQSGKQLAGLPWMLVYPAPNGGEPQLCEIQAPVG